MDSFEVLNFGSLNIDHVYCVDHFVRPGETLESLNYSVFCGGKGLNQSVALARAGVKTAHAGKIGRDGIFLKEFLEESGAQTSHILIGDTPTGHACIQIDAGGQNSIILYGGANAEISDNEIISILDTVAPGTWLLLQNEINSIPFIIDEAGKRQLKIAFNPAPCNDAVRNYPLDKVDLIFVNEIEAAQLSSCSGSFEDIADAMQKMLPDTQIVMTLGENGAYYFSGSKRIFTPAVQTRVVDTTGAGDTFCGYFLASLLRGYTPEKAMEYAARAAAITVSRPGAGSSIPSAGEIF